MKSTLIIGVVLFAVTVGYMAISGKPNAVLVLCAGVQLFWIGVAAKNTPISDFQSDASDEPDERQNFGPIIDSKFGCNLHLQDGEYTITRGETYDKYERPAEAMRNWAKLKPPLKLPDSPRFTHDCCQCTFLGRWNEYDLYHCLKQPIMPTLIARFSSDGPDYTTGLVFKDIIPAIGEAHTRAEKAGLRLEAKRVG